MDLAADSGFNPIGLMMLVDECKNQIDFANDIKLFQQWFDGFPPADALQIWCEDDQDLICCLQSDWHKRIGSLTGTIQNHMVNGILTLADELGSSLLSFETYFVG